MKQCLLASLIMRSAPVTPQDAQVGSRRNLYPATQDFPLYVVNQRKCHNNTGYYFTCLKHTLDQLVVKGSSLLKPHSNGVSHQMETSSARFLMFIPQPGPAGQWPGRMSKALILIQHRPPHPGTQQQTQRHITDAARLGRQALHFVDSTIRGTHLLYWFP